jgi:hypothetical protein
MAQYQHLPIYKTTYELLVKITHATANFPKAYKYSLGDKLRTEIMEMVVFVFKANSSRTERAKHASDFLDRLQVVELMLRLSKDLRLLTVKQFAEIVLLSDSLGRQAQGWIKSSALLAESK